MRSIVLLSLLWLAACSAGAGSGYGGGRLGVNVADAALAGGAPATALGVARSILADAPNDAAALLRQGEAQYELGQTAAAEVSFRRALALRPADLRAELGLARVQLQSDPAAAASLLVSILRQQPENTAALTDLGVARDLQGRSAEAQSLYRKALALAPTLASAQTDLGLSLALSGQAEEGVAILQHIAAGENATPRQRQDLAAALALAGNTRDATDLLRSELPQSQVAEAIGSYESLQTTPH